MKAYIEERVKEVAKYMIDNKTTIRDTAKIFYVSKSTVEKDIRDRLREVAPQYKEDVEKVIQYNASVRHIRGGIATKQKYRG